MKINMISSSRVRPIKTELIRLKKRRQLAIKVKNVLSERLVVLTNELLTRSNEAKIIRRKLYEVLLHTYVKYNFMKSLYGAGIDSVILARIINSKCEFYTENIIGVKVNVVKLHLDGADFLSRIGLSDMKEQLNLLLEYLSELVRIENSIKTLLTEIKKTKRKVNALEYFIIPNLNSTIKAISMKFDEKEREEKTRLKKVKKMLEQRK